MKIDFHIHTIPTIWDANFEFSLDKLIDYVSSYGIDAIAITNHNCFDVNQFQVIKDALRGKTDVFPGIEVTIAPNNGHLLIISDNNNIDGFCAGCNMIKENIKELHDNISIQDVEKAFENFSKYLLIPHFDKSPSVDKNVLNVIKEHVYCGEVASAKKYARVKKSSDITPVLFSDARISEHLNMNKTKQTYISIGDCSLASIKLALKDSSKVSLSPAMNDEMFQVTPKVSIVNGLNIVMGERSSGKTYLLDEIADANESVKYIEQFSLLEKRNSNTFEERISSKKSGDIAAYFDEFSKVVRDVKEVDVESNLQSLENYLFSLKKSASEVSMQDVYSRCRMFSEVPYNEEDLQGINNLVKATIQLLDTDTYRELIDSVIPYTQLISLFKVLIAQLQTEDESLRKKNWINSIINNIKQELQTNTASTMIEDIDFYKIALDNKKIELFNKISNSLKESATILSDEMGRFSIVAEKRAYAGAGEMKAQSGKMIKFSDAFSHYHNPYEFLQHLKDIDTLPEDSYYQYFAKIDYKILNSYGLEVSGGEQSEFNLLNEITKARQHDILLIDEPESSFDNIFLKSDVNKMLKRISEEMPVVIVTHNSTVGASIHADYLIYTRRDIIDGKAVFKRFAGKPGDEFLISESGEKSTNIDSLLRCLEAGDDAYQQRRNDYEILKNR